MAKPATLDGYSDQYTVDCERVLVTLLRGLGPWKESVFLVGGLTPRYLVAARPPEVPAHAGTLDVDIVVDLQILADTAGYRTLEENLRAMRFERSTNERGQRLSWRWQTRTETHTIMWSDHETFYLQAKLEAFEGETLVHSKTWDEAIPRDLV